MYLITKPVGAKSTSANFPRLLTETLGTAGLAGDVRVGGWSGEAGFAAGDPEWFKHVAHVEEIEANVEINAAMSFAGVVRHPALTPSGTKSGMVTGAALFGAASSGAAGYGTAMHRAFAEVEWGGVTPALLAAWKSAALGELVVTEASACLEANELAIVFVHEAGAEVWRERPFEMLLDGAWITGVFDRVVLVRDGQGRVVEVTVYDFKTDRIRPEEIEQVTERYAGQMAIYRQAAARLTGLSADRVGCALVLTALRCVVAVDQPGAD